MPAQSKAQQRFFGWLKSNPQERKKRGITAKTADDFAGTKHDGLPERKESMDFTEFLEAVKEPAYKVKDKGAVCPKGYRLDAQTGTCVPMGPVQNSQNPDQKELNSPSTGYNVWGATGLNGDGYALAEEDMDRDYDREDEQEKEFKKADEKMKYGKEGKPETKNSLRPGEVRKFNKVTGKWESNKK